MLTAIQHASIAAKVLSLQNSTAEPSSSGFENKQFSLATLLHLATLGGAQVCDMEKTIGSFAPGKDFDALLVDLDAPNPGLWSGEIKREGVEAWLERFMFCGDDRNIERVYVQGRFVGGTQFRKNNFKN
jgi:guanine deaminase